MESFGDTSVARQICPHCRGIASAGAYCEHCGKALPMSTTPRLILAGGAQTEVGRRLQGDVFQKQAGTAAVALLAVAILQFAFGFLLVFAGIGEPPVYFAVFGFGAVFLGLAAWARTSALPAAIAGMTLYLSAVALDAIVNPSSLVSGILIKAIIIIVLTRAIRAGLQERRSRQGVPA